MSKAYFARELTTDGIIFSDIKIGKYNNKSVWMNYNDGDINEKRLNMHTPIMFNVFGVNDGKFEEGQDWLFDKVNNDEYKTLTFYHNCKGPNIFESQDLRQLVTDMEGTDILTYKWIKQKPRHNNNV